MLFKDLLRVFIGGNIDLWLNQELIYSSTIWDWTNLNKWGGCIVIGVMASVSKSGTVMIVIKEVE
jgi:hypothetical protein